MVLFRGFRHNENGSKTISIAGEDIKGEWVYGDFELYSMQSIIITRGGTKERYKVRPTTVGWYIGEDDANNKRVFTGDVCCDENKNNFTVAWDKKILAVMAVYSDERKEFLSKIWSSKCEVIGNILDKK